MNEGIPVQRHFVLISNLGQIVIDWGNQIFQDVFTGETLSLENDYVVNPLQNADLEVLKNSGVVLHFDHLYVYFSNLPELEK